MKKYLWLVLLLPLLFYAPNIDRFAFPLYSQYSDLLITHWPNANFVHNSMVQYHQIPLWSNAILGGYPFFANPLAGLWYLPNWISNLWPSAAAFNLLFLIHLFFGALAIFLILREENIPPELAILGALIFELMPKIWAHFGQGHISLVYAVCLTPWFLLVSRRALLGKKGNPYWCLPCFLFAGIILADPRWAIYAGLIWILYSGSIFLTRRSVFGEKAASFLVFIFGHLFLGVMLSAILLIPMIQYSQLSTRSLMTLEDNLAFSLPISKLFLILFPSLGITAEWVFYLGGLGLVSLLLALINQKILKLTSIWLIVFGLGLVLSISGYVPGFSSIWQLPVLNLMRVPSRALFLTGFSASFIVPYVIAGIFENKINRKSSNLALAGLIAVGVLVGLFTFTGISSEVRGFQIGSLSLIVYSLIIFVFIQRGIKNPVWAWLLSFLVLLEFSYLNLSTLRFEKMEIAFAKGQSFLEFLPRDEENPFRIFTPSNSIPQNLASRAGLEMVNGVDPLQLQSLHDFLAFRAESGEAQSGYSVTFPAFSTGNPETDNKNLILDAKKLGLLNVKYIVSAFPIENANLNLLEKTEDGYIYDNQEFRPRAWIQNPAQETGQGALEEVPVRIQPNSIALTTSGAGLLVLSEIMYPGWKAFLDGQELPIQTQAGLLRGIEVPSGHHAVEFQFQPWSLYLGAVISALTLIGIVIYAFYQRRKKI